MTAASSNPCAHNDWTLGGVSPGLGIEYYDRDDVGVYPKLKYSNDAFREACGHPHTYPQLIFVK